MTLRLNQLLAVERGTSQRVHTELVRLYRLLQDPTKLSGISRTYQPKEDDGDRLPSEGTKLQVDAATVLSQVGQQLATMFDLTLTKDVSNQLAQADLVVDGVLIAERVPATYLLFLEKQLQELATLLRSLPVLDPSETWTWSDSTGSWRTEPAQTTRSKKIPRNHVKAEATREHPAQVEIFYEDQIVGTWTTIKYSGALEQTKLHAMRDRLAKLIDAVRSARETANMITVTEQVVGSRLFGYLFDH